MATGGRYLLTAATTTYENLGESDQRLELEQDVARVRELFTGTLGYQNVPLRSPGTNREVSINPTRHELQGALDEFLGSGERSENDLIVVYYVGHAAILDNGEYHLLPTNFRQGEEERTGIPAQEFARWITTGPTVPKLLLMLDTCHAGAAGIEFVQRVARSAGSAAVIVAARPLQEAQSGAFTQALLRAVANPATGGRLAASLPIDEVVKVMNADPATPTWQTVGCHLLGMESGQPAFLPNPRHDPKLADLDLVSRRRQDQKRLRDAEMTRVFLPRARGGDAVDDHRWRFVGRHKAISHLASWLGNVDSDRRPRIITGNPGSGKSAVIGRLAALADPQLRSRIPELHRLPSETLPPIGAYIAATIDARAKTDEQLIEAIASAGDLTASTVRDLVDRLEEDRAPLVVAVDGLDEAIDPVGVARTVIWPLLEASATSPLRILIGTRPHLLSELGVRVWHEGRLRKVRDPRGRAIVVDLDVHPYRDAAAIQGYAKLWRSGLGAPNGTEGGGALDRVADAISDAAGDSFLVALILSRTLAQVPIPSIPSDNETYIKLPRTAGQAMRQELAARLGSQFGRALDLLQPLAYAQGDGLPWSDLWAPLASSICGRPYRDDDVEWLLSNSGSYVAETNTSFGSGYRLFHDALADELRRERDGQDQAEVHRAFADLLIARSPLRDDGDPDWSQSDPYTRENLATHAGLAGRLDGLVLDPQFLLVAEQSRLLSALHCLHEEQALAAGDAYRHAAPILRQALGKERVSYLQLAALTFGADALVARIGSGTSRPWSARWARIGAEVAHSAMPGHNQAVLGVTATELAGAPVAVSAGQDGTVRIWDLYSGSSLGAPMRGHAGKAWSPSIGQLSGRPVVVTAGEDGTVRRWDLISGLPIGEPTPPDGGRLTSVALATLDGQQLVVSAGEDGLIRTWDLATGVPVGSPMSGHTDWARTVAVGDVDGRPVVVSGGDDATLRLWDLDGRCELVAPMTGHRGQIWMVSIGSDLAGRPVAISAGMDGTLRKWDLRRGAELWEHPVRDQFAGAFAVACGVLDGRPVVASSGRDGIIRIRDVDSGALVRPRVGLQPSLVGEGFPWVWCVAFSELAGHTIVLSGHNDGTVRAWDLLLSDPASSLRAGLGRRARGLRPESLGGWAELSTDAAAAAQSILLAAAEIGPDFVREAGQTIGKMVAPVTGPGLPSEFQGDELTRFREGLASLAGTPLETNEVGAVAIGDVDGRLLAIYGEGTNVQVRDLKDGKPHLPPLVGDSRVLAVAVGDLAGRPIIVSSPYSGHLRLWEAASGQPIAAPNIRRRSYPSAMACVGLSGRLTLAFSEGRTIHTIDLGNDEARALTGHAKDVVALLATELAGRPVLISGSVDRTVRLWDPATGDQLGGTSLDPSSPIGCMTVVDSASHGKMLGLGGLDHSLRFWSVSSLGLTGEPKQSDSNGETVFALAVVRPIHSWILPGAVVAIAPGFEGCVMVGAGEAIFLYDLQGNLIRAVELGARVVALASAGRHVVVGTTVGVIALRFEEENYLDTWRTYDIT
jgi:WD40 repeat protein